MTLGSRSLVTLLAALTLCAGLLGLAPSPANSQQSTPVDAVSALGGCLVGQGAGDILLLLDQSASLQTSDQDNARVASAVYLAEGLADFSASSGVDLSLGVAGFDVNFTQRSGWESVQDGSADDTTSSLESMRTENTGWETDYWNALEGGRAMLRDRANALGQVTRCQAIVWFTDGEFELDSRSTHQERQAYGITKLYAPGIELTTDEAARQAEAVGTESLCRPGGLADQIRDSGIRLLSVGLQGDASAQDFGFMQAIATGTSPTGSLCGAIHRPDSGSFTLANNINDLLFAFDDLSTPEQPPTKDEKKVCTTSGCPEGQHAVVLDESVRSVRILAGSDLPNATVELRSPASGAPIIIGTGESGARDIADVSAAWTWISPTAVQIVLDPAEQDASGWAGVWSVTFVDPTATPKSLARTNIHVEGDLAPALLNADEIDWRVGEEIEGLEFGLTRRGTQESVDPESVVSTIAFSATLEPAVGPVQILLQGATAAQLGEPLSLDLTDYQPGPAVLTLQLKVTTAPATGADGTAYAGTALTPQTSRLQLTLAAPADFPTVATQLDFGTSEGVGPLSAELPVEGPGCVWLANVATTTAPDGVGTVAVTTDTATSPETCLEVGDGEESVLPLSLAVERAGNGAVTGTLKVLTRPLDEPNLTAEQPVSYFADLRKPVNEAERNWLFLLLGILGTVVPLALLWLMAWSQARITGGSVYVGRANVELQGGWLSRIGQPGPLQFTAQELVFLPIPENGARSLIVEEGTPVTLTTNARNPLEPCVMVQADGFDVATKAGGPNLPLSPKNQWILLRDQSSGRLLLILLLSATASDQDRDDLISDVSGRAENIVAAWPLRASPLERDEWDSNGYAQSQVGNTRAGGEESWGRAPTAATTWTNDTISTGDADGDSWGSTSDGDTWVDPGDQPPSSDRGGW